MPVSVKRLGLIITPDIHPIVGNNINGPCCIKVPEWCQNRRGNFYLYFSDHMGDCIKLAYADEILGPWRVSNEAALNLSGFSDAYDHMASPEIYIDHDKHEIRLYFHARSRSRGREQWTFLANSHDGYSFKKCVDKPLAPFYLRLIYWKKCFYGISKGGNLWYSKDGKSAFLPGGNPFDRNLSNEIWHNNQGAIRHVGLSVLDDVLKVYFTRIGHGPERILRSNIAISDPNCINWSAEPEEEVLRPELDYEGVNMPIVKTTSGSSLNFENALRDPYIINVGNETYMFYVVGGESGIAICRLTE